MKARYFAAATVTIHASPDAIWQALTDPATLKECMFGSNVTTDWHVGSPITFSGTWQGEPYKDKGEITAVLPPERLTMTYFSPLSGKEDKIDNYNTVSYMIEPHSEGATELMICQDNIESKDAATQSNKNWEAVIVSLKKVLEAQ